MSYASEVMADGPRAWYRCHEASGQLRDSSGFGNHTTATVGAGSCTYRQPGPIVAEGTSIKLNTPFAFTAPDHSSLDLGDVLTIEYWVAMADFSAVSSWIVNKDSDAYASGVTLTGGDAVFDLIHRGWVVVVTSSAAGGASPSAWHHYVSTKDGATVKQYWNGDDVTGAVTNSTMLNNASVLNIGDIWDDHLAEVALYPTALSQERVRAHYAAALGLPLRSQSLDFDYAR